MSQFFQFEQFIVDGVHHKLYRIDQVMSDDEKTVKFLYLLSSRYPELVSKQELIDELWPGQVVTEWSLSKLVSDVRQLLGDSGKDQGYIKTVRGKGFRLNADVIEIQEKIEPKPSKIDRSYIKGKRLLPLVAVILAVAVIGLVSFYPNKDNSSSSPIRVAVLPVISDSDKPIHSWIEYGIMSMASVQLAQYQSIQTLPVSTVINVASDIKDSLIGQKTFNKVCEPIGCTHLVLINHSTNQNNQSIFKYQIFQSQPKLTSPEFVKMDAIDAADLMFDQLARDLIPSNKANLKLEHSFTKNQKANRDYAIGVSDLYSGELKSARVYLEQAIEREEDFFWAKAYLAEVFYRSGELVKARELTSLLESEEPEPMREYYLQHLISNILYAQGELDASLNISIALEQNAFVKKDPLLLANELLNIGSSFQAKGELEKAKNYLSKAQQQYQLAKFGSGEGKALFNLANVYISLSEEEKAVEYYQKAREIFIRYKMTGYALMAKHQIATTSIYLGRVKYAESELGLIIEAYQQIGDLQGELTAGVDLVYASVAKLEHEQAIDRGEAILPRVIDSQISYLEAHLRKMLTISYLRIGNVETADLHYSSIKDKWEDKRPGFVFIPAHIVQAKGDIAKALEMANQIKLELGKSWTEKHQNVLVQFEKSAAQNKVLPISY